MTLSLLCMSLLTGDGMYILIGNSGHSSFRASDRGISCLNIQFCCGSIFIKPYGLGLKVEKWDRAMEYVQGVNCPLKIFPISFSIALLSTLFKIAPLVRTLGFTTSWKQLILGDSISLQKLNFETSIEHSFYGSSGLIGIMLCLLVLFRPLV